MILFSEPDEHDNVYNMLILIVLCSLYNLLHAAINNRTIAFFTRHSDRWQSYLHCWSPQKKVKLQIIQNVTSDCNGSTTLHLQTFRILLYTSVQDSYTSNFCFSTSLFSSIPTSTYTMIAFINPTSTDTKIIQHI